MAYSTNPNLPKARATAKNVLKCSFGSYLCYCLRNAPIVERQGRCYPCDQR